MEPKSTDTTGQREARLPPPDPPTIPSNNLHAWYEYADRWLQAPLGRTLDFGCGAGVFMARIADRCSECHGVEVDPAKVAIAAERLANGHFQAIEPGRPLPFPDGSFDTVLILEVIEHVADEAAVLRELARVLRPGGRLLLTTPHEGLLTFLDPGNVKFMVPGLHRFIHRRMLRQRGYYEQRFGGERQSEQKMIADFTVDQDPWHRHYRYERIRTLAPAALRTVAWAAYFPAFRALWMLKLTLAVVTFGLVKKIPWPFSAMYRALSRRQSIWGDQLVVMFEKSAP